MRTAQFGTALLGLGLAILFAVAWCPRAPVVTAMAIIALGATEVTLSRFRGSVAALPVVLLHGVTYALLYALFVGARLHVPTAAPTTGASGFVMLDLIASAFPMSIVLKRISSSLWQSTLSRH